MMDIIAADGISVTFNPKGGIIHDLVIDVDGSEKLRPLHRAPWVRSGETLPEGVAPVESRLAGDFFCAPFGKSSPDLPIHGWSANGAWDSAGQRTGDDRSLTVTYRLRETIEGARLTKRITLCPGHPVVYQSHVFEGGRGHIPIAHHAMVHVPGGARLSFSSKASGGTLAAALEIDPTRGRSILAYPQKFEALSSVRRADGGFSDASFYPFDSGHEDLVILPETSGVRLGWSVALAAKDGFLFFAVKDARLLPQTILWMSNGGRDYPPWNSRHHAVLGIEEAAAALLPGGHTDDEAALTGLHLAPGKATEIRYAFGAIPAPPGWTRVAQIRLSKDSITLIDAGGDSRALPFHGAHFDGLL